MCAMNGLFSKIRTWTVLEEGEKQGFSKKAIITNQVHLGQMHCLFLMCYHYLLTTIIVLEDIKLMTKAKYKRMMKGKKRAAIRR